MAVTATVPGHNGAQAASGDRATSAFPADPSCLTAAQRRAMSPLSVRFPRNSGRDVALGHVTRPLWRGRVHLLALWFAVPSLMLLVVNTDTTVARVGVTIYAAGFCLMLTTSVTYHRWVHGLHARAMWRRADHAMIFAAMAGSATPVALLAMPGLPGQMLVASIWAASLAGAGFKLCRSERGDGIGSKFYAGVSVLSAFTFPFVWMHAGVMPAMLVALAGACYILGAFWFSKYWPVLRPTTFSYHEVWHLFTVVAATAHFAAVWAIAT